LRSISANLIADPDEATESARQAKGVYAQVVRAEIENYAWGFAKEQVRLPEAAQPPLFKFGRAYTLPSDFVRLVELENRWVFDVVRHIDGNPTPAYEIVGREIHTNFGAPLGITYLKDLSEDPTLWSPLFGQTVSAALALALAMPLTKSDSMVSMAEKLYRRAVARAKTSGAIQMAPANIPDGSWVTARLY
jgi:hypothetical protein